MQKQYFGTDGIRGLANHPPMTVEEAVQLGKALVQVLPKRGHSFKLLIGKDTRRSGYMFEAAIAAGANAMGGDVFFTGPLPTPALAHLTQAMRCDAGVVISASHNPYYDNGIKIFAADAFKLPDALEAELEAKLLDPEHIHSRVKAAQIGRSKRIDDAQGRYNAFVKSSFERELSLDGLKIVIDCAHGAAYKVAPTVLMELGAEVISTGVEPNGYNINEGVGALHPEHCAALVLQHKADLGLALDGDADRLILIDEKAQIVDGDAILAMLAIDMKARDLLRHNTLVTTVMSNLGLHQAMKKEGIQTLQTAVGDRYVVSEMRRANYSLGGEQSGHIVLLDYASTGDGLLAALRVLSCLQRQKMSLSTLAQVMQKLPQILLSFPVDRKIPLQELKRSWPLIQDITENYGDEGRVLVRYSGTENKCRVMLEGPNQHVLERDAQALAAMIARETEL